MTSKFEKKIKTSAQSRILKKYFDQEFADSMPIATLEAYHLESLKEIVTQAYEKCEFYRQKMDEANVKPEDIKNLQDLGKLPLLKKDELRGKPWALLACDKEDIAIVQVSTGTTGGEEIYMMYTWEDYYLHEFAPGYPKLFNIEENDICFNALPYEMSSSGLAFHKIFLEACQATVIPAGKGGAYSTPEKSVRMMKDLQPTVVITTPSWAVRLAETAAEMDFDLKKLPLKKLWLTGEGCSPSFRNRVEALWGATANFYYGSLECGGLGVECDNHSGYHLSLAHAIVEVIDPNTGEVLEPGEIGEIVITCPQRYATPIIRYRTKDLGYIETETCSCGVSLPRLILRGRLVDHITVQGVSFSPIYLEEFLMKNPEVGNWFEFIVDSQDAEKLTIRCELSNEVTPSEELAESLSSKLEFSVGVPCQFEFVERMPRPFGKTVRVRKQI